MKGTEASLIAIALLAGSTARVRVLLLPPPPPRFGLVVLVLLWLVKLWMCFCMRKSCAEDSLAFILMHSCTGGDLLDRKRKNHGVSPQDLPQPSAHAGFSFISVRCTDDG
jgi:hypothetical protein